MMPLLLWDSSGLSKRYFPETGTATINALFDVTPELPMLATFTAYAETVAVLRRKRNGGEMSAPVHFRARMALEREGLYGARLALLSVTDSMVLAGVHLADRHNINSTDAAMLAAYLELVHSQEPSDPACVFVCSDRRLLRAARIEGLRILNPESLLPAAVPAFLASF